jgi:hypothetical protein
VVLILHVILGDRIRGSIYISIKSNSTIGIGITTAIIISYYIRTAISISISISNTTSSSIAIKSRTIKLTALHPAILRRLSAITHDAFVGIFISIDFREVSHVCYILPIL